MSRTAAYIMSHKSSIIYCLSRAINLCCITQRCNSEDSCLSELCAHKHNINRSISFMVMDAHRQLDSNLVKGANHNKFKCRCLLLSFYFLSVYVPQVNFPFMSGPRREAVISGFALWWMVNACSNKSLCEGRDGTLRVVFMVFISKSWDLGRRAACAVERHENWSWKNTKKTDAGVRWEFPVWWNCRKMHKRLFRD